MTEIIKKNLSIILIIGFALFTFWDLPKTFYQQDEWQTLGHNLANGFFNYIRDSNPLLLIFGEKRPLSNLMYLFLLGYYKFTVLPSAIFAIFFHIINSILLFNLVEKLTSKKIIAFLAAIFFVTNSVSHQAVSWTSAVSTLPAVTLILTAITAYFKFLENEERKYLIISITFFITSLYFKGSGVFLFFLFPLIFFLYKDFSFNKKNLKFLLRVNLPFFALGFLMFVFRLGNIFLRTKKVAGFALRGENFIASSIFHTLIYPITSLFQIFIPPLDLYKMTPIIAKIQYKYLIGSPLTDLIAQSIIADMISILGSAVILGLLALIMYKSKNKHVKRNIIFALLFFFLSFLPYVALDRDSSYLSSRYFYLGAIPAGIIFGYIVYFLAGLSKYSKWIIFPLVLLFLFHHANIVRGDINHQVKLGNERKAVLNGIRALKPTLDQQTIFYVTSDKEYYGPITNPFQNGLGYVLEVWYYDGSNIPKEFLSENFLWDLGSEGYRSNGSKGFGYFQDINKLVDQLKRNKFESGKVYGFFIKSNEQKVIDITEETRERISTISADVNNESR